VGRFASAGNCRGDCSHRSPRTSAEIAKLKEPMGPYETCLVRMTQLIAIVDANYSKASLWVHRDECARAARATHANVPALHCNHSPAGLHRNPATVAAQGTKRANAQRSTELPDGLLGGRATHALTGDHSSALLQSGRAPEPFHSRPEITPQR